jgi:hypothetical protein
MPNSPRRQSCFKHKVFKCVCSGGGFDSKLFYFYFIVFIVICTQQTMCSPQSSCIAGHAYAWFQPYMSSKIPLRQHMQTWHVSTVWQTINLPDACQRSPYGFLNGGLPIPMWGVRFVHGHGRHTTRITIVLAFWQTSENVILIIFGISQKLLICSILTSASDLAVVLACFSLALCIS